MSFRSAVLCFLLVSAVPAAGQLPLPGTWEQVHFEEHAITASTLDLVEGGAVRLSSVSQWSYLGGGSDISFPTPVTLSFEGAGTWVDAGGRLSMTLTSSRMLIDGETFDAGLARIAELAARTLADEMGLPEEDYAEFAALIHLSLLEALNEQTLLAEILGDLQTGIPYRIDGQNLWLTDSDGIEMPWSPAAPTAVMPSGWARVKSMSR